MGQYNDDYDYDTFISFMRQNIHIFQRMPTLQEFAWPMVLQKYICGSMELSVSERHFVEHAMQNDDVSIICVWYRSSYDSSTRLPIYPKFTTPKEVARMLALGMQRICGFEDIVSASRTVFLYCLE